MTDEGISEICTAAIIIAIIVSITACSMHISKAINYDRDEILSEEGKIRNEYLSKAGTLPSFDRDGQPNGGTIHANCCGIGDAYEADDYEIAPDGSLWAILTCNDPENCKEITGKIVRAPGTKFRIAPRIVLKNFDPVNNTGHGWVYISPTATDEEGNPVALCWAAPAGG